MEPLHTIFSSINQNSWNVLALIYIQDRENEERLDYHPEEEYYFLESLKINLKAGEKGNFSTTQETVQDFANLVVGVIQSE